MRKGQDKKEIMPNFLKERSRTGRRRKGAESGRGYMRAAV